MCVAHLYEAFCYSIKMATKLRNEIFEITI